MNLNTSKDFTGWESRTARAIPGTLRKEDKAVIVEAVVTTEQPAVVADWEKWELVREILLMDGAVLPENKQVPLLNTHSRMSTSDVKGSIRNLRVEKSDVVGDVYFWSKAQDEISQVEEGHLTDLSAGYKTFGKEFTVEIEPGKEKEVNGRTFKNNFNDGLRLLIRTKWELKEGSLVPIGADSAAKFRSELQSNQSFNHSPIQPITHSFIQSSDPDLQQKLNDVFDEVKSIKSELKIKLNKEYKMENEQEKTSQEILADERARVAEITALAKRHNLDPTEALQNGTSIEQFRGIVLDKIGSAKPLEKDPSVLDLSNKEKEKFSLSRLIRTQIPNDPLYHAKTFETELADELEKRLGKKAKGKFIPYDAMSGIMKRDLQAGGTGTGAEWVSQVWRGQDFIELLRNKMVLQAHGAQVWSGLTGNVLVPRLSVGSTYGWRSTENAAISESTPTTAQLNLTPHSGGTYVDISKELIYQGNPSVEATITNDILKACAIGLDAAGLVGAGSSGEPSGIAVTSGIGSFNGSSIAWTDIIEALTDVESGNADVPSMAFLTTPTVRGVLKGRPKETGGATGYLCGENNIVLGYPCDITNSITAGYLFFGDFSQVIIAMWSGLDVLVDPYTGSLTGLVRVIVDQFVDIGVRQPAAFSLATSVT